GPDTDLPTEWELRAFGNSRLGKFVWLFFLPFWYAIIHPLQTKHLPLDRWLALNWAVTAGVFAASLYWGGVTMVLYLFLSTWFAVGMHPTGAHILQEHIWFGE